jgi:hypothetical protein
MVGIIADLLPACSLCKNINKGLIALARHHKKRNISTEPIPFLSWKNNRDHHMREQHARFTY